MHNVHYRVFFEGAAVFAKTDDYSKSSVNAIMKKANKSYRS